MLSSKQSVRDLVEICALKGIRQIVISPGSRNAPLTISFNEHGGFNTYCIHDERCAGFFALGIAQQLDEPVAICCTSGSACLNYAPAIVEAYYQRIPILVLTADRPEEWIDHGEGQSIRQKDIFANYIEHSAHLDSNLVDDTTGINAKIIDETINKAMSLNGPVHINLPFAEPLYELKEYNEPLPIVSDVEVKESELDLDVLTEEWKSSKKKMILCGLLKKDDKLNHFLELLSADSSVTVLTENTSNLNHRNFIHCLDRSLAAITEDKIKEYQPDLLVTLGHSIISKRIKGFLRNSDVKHHWNFNPNGKEVDTFRKLTKTISANPVKVFKHLTNNIEKSVVGTFNKKWKHLDYLTQEKHLKFLQNAPFSDLKTYGLILDFLPDGVNLQMGNSACVRYLNLFDPYNTVIYNSNRGVSGIDGCTSTALGAAWVNDKQTVLVSGDVSFLYDSNALWIENQNPNLRMIVVNNSGGGIFRFIDGPSKTNQLEKFFEAKHQTELSHLSKAYNINYGKAQNEEELIKELEQFFQPSENNRPKILEIFTPREENDKVLKAYFGSLKG